MCVLNVFHRCFYVLSELSTTKNLHDFKTNCSLSRQHICTISRYIFLKNGKQWIGPLLKIYSVDKEFVWYFRFHHELLIKHLTIDSLAKHQKPPNAHKHVYFKRNTHPWLCLSVQAFTFPGICTIYQRHFIHNQTTKHNAEHNTRGLSNCM